MSKFWETNTPHEALRVHRFLKWMWVFPGIPISFILRQSVPYLVFLSVYAIIVSHWSAQEAAEAACKAEEADNEA